MNALKRGVRAYRKCRVIGHPFKLSIRCAWAHVREGDS